VASADGDCLRRLSPPARGRSGHPEQRQPGQPDHRDYSLAITAQRRQAGTCGPKWALIGALLGVGFLTKATVYIMVPVVGLALWRRYRQQRLALWRATVKVALPALLLGLLWWVRNLAVYGGFDILGKAAHDRVVVGQLRTADWIAQQGLAPALRQFAVTSFQSFWGQFGWMGVVMDRWVYAALALFSLAVIAGLALAWRRRRWNGARRQQAALLAATLLATLAVYLGYNLTFLQAQGRYLFPALIPLACAVAAGLAGWARCSSASGAGPTGWCRRD
jgi:4-amino-4-deoxy-L-arabinose transferase-like glycosyltransferase